MKEKTLAEHAEAWWKERGKVVPPKKTTAWQVMYEKWVNWAFQSFKEPKK